MWKDLGNVGTSGSECGIIIKDEEYKDSCRITLEECSSHYAITCGIYGAMVHTAFCNEWGYEEKYEAMKRDLQDFIDKDTTEDEELEFYDSFCSKY